MDNQKLDQLGKEINLFLDNALPKEECKKLLDRMDSDQQCCQMMENEKQLRCYIKDNLKRSSASDDLKNLIKSTLK